MLRFFQIIKRNQVVALDTETNEFLELKEFGGQPHKDIPSHEKFVVKPIIERPLKADKKGSFTWSRNYEHCQQCQTTETKHASGGLCRNCYNRSKKAKNPNTRKYNRKAYQNSNIPISSAGNRYRCTECEDEFVSVLDKMDVVCPSCRSIHVNKIN